MAVAEQEKKFIIMKKVFLLVFAASILVACEESSKSIQLSPSSVNLYYDETQQIQVLSETGSFEWSTANDFHATVSSSGKITTGHVGSTIITAKQGKKEGTCSVTIKPKYYLYDTPYFGWGETMTQVSNKLGTPDQIQTNVLVYVLSEADGIIAMYMFTDGKLTGVGITLNVKNATTLTYYLVERYQPFSAENGTYYFMNAMNFDDATIGLMMRYVSTSSMHYYQVVYAPINQQQNAPVRHAPYGDKQRDVVIPNEYLYLFD